MPRRKRLSAATKAAYARATRKESEATTAHAATSDSPVIPQPLVDASTQTSPPVSPCRKRCHRSVAAIVNQRRRKFRLWSSQTKRCREYVPGTSFYLFWRTKMRHKYRTYIYFRKQWRQRMRSRYQDNAEYRSQWRQTMRERTRSQYHDSPDYRSQCRLQMRSRYRVNPNFRETWKQKMNGD